MHLQVIWCSKGGCGVDMDSRALCRRQPAALAFLQPTAQTAYPNENHLLVDDGDGAPVLRLQGCCCGCLARAHRLQGESGRQRRRCRMVERSTAAKTIPASFSPRHCGQDCLARAGSSSVNSCSSPPCSRRAPPSCPVPLADIRHRIERQNNFGSYFARLDKHLSQLGTFRSGALNLVERSC